MGVETPPPLPTWFGAHPELCSRRPLFLRVLGSSSLRLSDCFPCASVSPPLSTVSPYLFLIPLFCLCLQARRSFSSLSPGLTNCLCVCVSLFGLPATQVFDIYLLLNPLSYLPCPSTQYLSISPLPISVSPFLSLPDVSASLHLGPSQSVSPHLCLSLSLCPVNISISTFPCHPHLHHRWIALSHSPPSVSWSLSSCLICSVSTCPPSMPISVSLALSLFSTSLLISGKAIFLSPYAPPALP